MFAFDAAYVRRTQGDFGIARVADADSTMTHKGTMIYQAPEIARGERFYFAADVFSFAMTMYEVCLRVSLL